MVPDTLWNSFKGLPDARGALGFLFAVPVEQVACRAVASGAVEQIVDRHHELPIVGGSFGEGHRFCRGTRRHRIDYGLLGIRYPEGQQLAIPPCQVRVDGDDGLPVQVFQRVGYQAIPYKTTAEVDGYRFLRNIDASETG